jgi:hypothetical protein
VGGVAELSDDPAVRLVPPADPRALAEGIMMALAAPARVRNPNSRTWKEYAEALLDVLLSGSSASLPNPA